MTAAEPAARAHRSTRPDAADVSRPPIVTFGLLAIMVAVFLAMYSVGHGDVMQVADQFGAKNSELIRQGQWWRLITPIFLHGSWLHLGVNGLSLLWFGGQMERLYGARKYLLIFLFAGVAGNLLSYLLLPQESLGASGALFGLVGAGLVFPLRFKSLVAPKARAIILKELTAVAVLNIGISFSPGIDRWAHFGGLLGGAFLALFLVPGLLDQREPSPGRSAMLSVVTAAAVAVVGAAGWEQARIAVSTPPQVGYTITLPSGGLSWTVYLPETWKPAQQGSNPGVAWNGPGGARISILDSWSMPQLPGLTSRWSNPAAGVAPVRTTVAREPALFFTVASGGAVQRIYAIDVAGGLVDVILDAKPAVLPNADGVLRQMMQTWQFAGGKPQAGK